MQSVRRGGSLPLRVMMVDPLFLTACCEFYKHDLLGSPRVVLANLGGLFPPTVLGARMERTSPDCPLSQLGW